ncbi:AraC family transcriptional regulator, partial [Bacillus thuringiensis]|nr:AraC family transcriptional regulator [Bacillus thuringiensis]
EDEFKVNQIELELGNYSSIYNEVLVNHKKTSHKVPPVMYQAIDLFLEMLTEDNAVMKFISKNKDLSTRELLIKLFYLFPTIGYGDTQYIELINKIKKKATPKI